MHVNPEGIRYEVLLDELQGQPRSLVCGTIDHPVTHVLHAMNAACQWIEDHLSPALTEPEACDHSGDTVERVAHGYLGDAPAGTVELLCSECGAEVAPPLWVPFSTVQAGARDRGYVLAFVKIEGRTITVADPRGGADEKIGTTYDRASGTPGEVERQRLDRCEVTP